MRKTGKKARVAKKGGNDSNWFEEAESIADGGQRWKPTYTSGLQNPQKAGDFVALYAAETGDEVEGQGRVLKADSIKII